MLRQCDPWKASGFSYLELLIVVIIGSVLILALNGIAGTALQTRDTVHHKNDLTEQPEFAMGRMTRAIRRSRLLLLPPG